MPNTAKTPDPTAPEPSRNPSPAASPPLPEPPPASIPGPPGEAKSALFRALVDAGAGVVVAYTADQYVHSMTSGNVALHTQPILVEMRRLFAEQGRQIAEQGRQIAEQSRQIAALREIVARHDAKLDAVKRELRLVWGALGILITLLTVVFGFLFQGLNQ